MFRITIVYILYQLLHSYYINYYLETQLIFYYYMTQHQLVQSLFFSFIYGIQIQTNDADNNILSIYIN